MAGNVYRSPFPDVDIPEVSLAEFVLEGATARADKQALIDGASGRTITYGQLAAGVRRAAAGLSRRGFAKGDVLAIFSPNLPEYAIAFHAVASLGGANTTINPLYTVGELRGQLVDSGAKYLLTIPQLLERAKEAARDTSVREMFVFGDAPGAVPFAALLEGAGGPPQPRIDPTNDVVALPYSSGTTGFPKGVMLTHRNLVANVCQVEVAAPTAEDTIDIGVLPFYHIYGLTVLLNSVLRGGGQLVTMARFDLEEFLGLIQRYRVTRAYLVPPIVLALAKHPAVANYDLSSLQAITSGAAPMSAELTEACRQRLGCSVVQGYGMTELSPVSHLSPRDRARPGSAGLLAPNTQCKVCDLNTGEALPPNQPGELCVRGPQVMKGYLNNPEATAQIIGQDGWLHTGDIAQVDEDGYLFVVDRLKELIKYKGYQVPPAELEAVLLTHPSVADAAVIGSPDEEAGEVPKAFIVPRGDVSAEDIIGYVEDRVAPYKRIRLLEFVEQIPKSSSGKILRRELIERERGSR
ncbi:MAG: 4-coumarate--CoA ligase family protein [Chloroflexota bacterium]|nr:4-coumarate--CoA ligase family protein [Chloroflexota bacterium]